jgi:hypothetical protein
MAISFVDQTSAATSSVALSASLQASDLILIFAYKATITMPSLPAGYTNVFSQSANGNSFRCGYKIAVGGDSSGTWTNADLVLAHIYRGASGVGGAGSNTNASAASTTIPGIGTFTKTDGTSWAVSFGGSLQVVSMSTPAGTTSRSSQIDLSLCMAIGVDSNAGVSSWGQHTSTNGLAAAGGGGSVELLAVVASSTAHNLTLLGVGS